MKYRGKGGWLSRVKDFPFSALMVSFGSMEGSVTIFRQAVKQHIQPVLKQPLVFGPPPACASDFLFSPSSRQDD